jgi:hypothetical protein
MSVEMVALARHARNTQTAAAWFVFVNDVGERWDSGFVLLSWN